MTAVRCQRRIASWLFTMLVIGMVVAGCGGGSSSSGGSSATEASSLDSGGTPPSEGSNSKPSTEFLGKGENGKLATVGTEAGATEREAASIAVEESLQAREDGDWATQCSSLAAGILKQIEESSSVLGTETDCEKALETQAQQAPPTVLANTMTGPIDVLRVVGGGRGIAFYHGIEGKDFVIPVRMERGEWKVESLAEQEIR